MKSMTKLMVVAMLLVAALVVAPAAARDISDGDIIYVGEEGLNFEELLGVGTATQVKLVHFTDKTVDNTVIVSADDAELRKSDIGSKTGSYYVVPSDKVLSTLPTADDNIPSVEIQEPSVTVDVRLYEESKDTKFDQMKNSVKDKSVTRNNKLFIRLDTNLYGFDSDDTDAPVMNIDVTLPGGSVVNEFRGVSLKNVFINESTKIFVPYDTTKQDTVKQVSINLSDVTGMSDAAAGTYTVQASWPSSADFYGKGFDSNTVTFEVLTKPLAISSDKDSVVRGNSFTVAISGESVEKYKVFIKDASIDDNKYPWIVDGQKGFKGFIKDDDGNEVDRGATFETTAGGTRSIQFDTNTDTDDRQFTIRVEKHDDDTTYDEVRVRVEKGSVTVTTSGTGTYYIGEEITLSGTCTDSDTVYLFMTGPNLPSNGANLRSLKSVSQIVKDDDDKDVIVKRFTKESVEADDTWSYKWNTAELDKSLDTGGYTIYAVSKEVDKDHLSDAEYGTVSIQLKPGYITAASSDATVAKGDDLKITGVAQGDPDNVRVWIFGKNYYGPTDDLYDTATVESDGSFEYKLGGSETKELSSGQYFVIIQHPMTNGYGFDVEFDKAKDEDVVRGAGIEEILITRLQASDAANALIRALDSPNIDDTYVKLTFNVAEAYIFIDSIGDQESGSTFTISGSTNAAVGNKIIVDVTSAAFSPTDKGEVAEFGAISGTAIVEKGNGVNTWSFEVDATDLKPDQYIVNVECIETDTSATATFNMVEVTEKPPVDEETPAPGDEDETPTEPADEETPTEAPPTPGFGALVALAGLGAVAFLVLRRK